MPQLASLPIPEPTALLFGLGDPSHTLAQPPHDALGHVRRMGIPCAWLDAPCASSHINSPLPDWLPVATTHAQCAAWPAPDACWQALMGLNISHIAGCVLVSNQPKLLQAGLNAGLWTIGLAACPATANEWQDLSPQECESRRARATLQLFALGVHSVIDTLSELHTCLADIGLRRLKGEKP